MSDNRNALGSKNILAVFHRMV